MTRNTQTFLSIIQFIKRSLINGLLVVLPLGLTFGLFAFSFRIITSWLEPIQSFVRHPITMLSSIPYLLYLEETALFIIVIFIVGIIVKALILQQLIAFAENTLFKLPLVRPIYSAIRQLIHAFTSHDKASFKQVVLVEFPRTGAYSIGFLTSELPISLSPAQGSTFYNVFIPTTPNPTSGFLVIIPERDITRIDLSRQEAMTIIISGGIVQPDRFTNPANNN